MPKKIVSFLIAITLVLPIFLTKQNEAYASTVQDVQDVSSSDDLEVIEPYVEVTEENIEPRSASIGKIVVGLSMWASHRNYHTSYTRTVVRQGKKYVVRYKAAPRSKCKYCKILSY